ncbi:MAG TPA: serine/threonine protein kinase, partial [Actinomycetota bacterium]|nr:serine/threonine protein kinase [Actinomycetota bacterium]
FAFASAVAAIDGKDGALAGMADRVDGPLAASFTQLDLAVGRAYPLASMLSRDATSGFEDLLYRWGGVGHDGFQAVDAAALTMGRVEQPYQFAPGRFFNLDANAVIKDGGPPSGSHSDIVHPEIAWALLSAAGIATGGA